MGTHVSDLLLYLTSPDMIRSVVPTGTPVSDKFCLCISPVVPTGTPVYE